MPHREVVRKLREDFMKGTLSESDVNKDPALQFDSWMSNAIESKIPEAQAMVLSTVSEDGKPSSRIVYLREFENGNFWFYGHYHSKKAMQMDKNNNICLNFFWPDLERQIRIEGTVTKANPSMADEYFRNRPYESQIGAWSSSQSNVLSSRKELEDNVEANRKKFDGKEIARPEFWGGFVLKANYYEFWQGRKNRLHDRIAYTLENNIWKINRLAP